MRPVPGVPCRCMVRYPDTPEGLRAHRLRGGFFEGWPDPPDPDEDLRLLENGDAGVHALEESGDVVGFITAIADNVLYAYIPLLEVLPAYQGGGVYRELLRRVLSGFRDLTWCGTALRPRAARPFYALLGMRPTAGKASRRRENQAGRKPPGTIY